MKPIDLFELNKLIWLLEKRLGFDCYALPVSKFKQAWGLLVYDRVKANVERQTPFHFQDPHHKFLTQLLNGMRYQWRDHKFAPRHMRPNDPGAMEYSYIVITGIEDG